MSGYTPERLCELLPAVFRQRDAEGNHSLRDLITVLGKEAQVLEEEIERLYKNWFIETCDDWVVPYIGDLIGVQPTSAGQLSSRAEIANTLGYRRRKGTLAVLEQLARDVTGWPARAVEYFTLLSTTQNLNHLRMNNHGTPDLRDSAALSRPGGPFESTAHLLEVRDIANGDGRYNIPNIGVHLWRLGAYKIERGVAHEVEDDTGLHFTFSPLGNDIPLFRHPEPIPSPFSSSTKRNVPDPLERHVLREELEDLYSENASVGVWDGDEFIDSQFVAVCNLTDWHHPVPAGKTISIDPELGRIAFDQPPASGIVRVLYHHGFSADLGGGSYDRDEASDTSEVRIFHVGTDFQTIEAALEAWNALPDSDRRELPSVFLFHVGTDQSASSFQTVASALIGWNALPDTVRQELRSVIQIDDSSTYRETLPEIDMPGRSSLTIRAAAGARPALFLDSELSVVGGAGSEFRLDGLLVANQAIRVNGELERLRIRHCTLVPGRRLSGTGQPLEPGDASLIIGAATTDVEIERSIVGALRSVVDCRVTVRDSIVDANGASNLAFQGEEDGTPGGVSTFERATIIGGVQTTEIRMATDTLFLGLVEGLRRQQGCVRFSYVPRGSVVPRRFHCQPAAPEGATQDEIERLARKSRPRFTSLRYGDPGYCQLAPDSPAQIRRGAEDESEMGAFCYLKQSHREESLRIRLSEYLRLGMEAGILYTT